jgi:diguanylate cyclase (GGDEF)-like protein/PAS domain S-box-containing protein
MQAQQGRRLGEPMQSIAERSTRHPWWQRLHAALMPDYNAKATAYWWLMVVLGSAVLAWSVIDLAGISWQVQLQIAIGTVLAATAGFFPLRLPRQKNAFVAGEIFIFLLLLLHGPDAAALGAAGEALVGSWRTSKRWTSRIVSPAVAAISMFAIGSLLHAALGAVRAWGWGNQGFVLMLTMVAAIGYFLVTALLVSTVMRLKRNERFEARALFDNFAWVGITYAGSAVIAALLYMSFRQGGVSVLVAGAPLLVMLLSTLHYYFRQQETARQAQQGEIDAAVREAEQAERHLRAMRDSERRFHSAFTHASIGMALVSVGGHVLQANLALQGLLGRSAEELIGSAFTDHVARGDRAAFDTQLARAYRHEVEAFALELQCLRRDDADIWIALNASFFTENTSTAPCLILQVQDITARRQAETQLHHIAFHDGLTGLPNRRRFNQLLDRAVERARQDPADGFGVMFLDCDRFKLINDSMGHSVGDEFLVHVARCIQAHVRPNDVVARLGGDEFAVLLDGGLEPQAITGMADRLLEALRVPLMVGDVSVSSSVSIGITCSSFGYETREDVLRDADLAMYRAKAAGKARYAMFDAGMRAQVGDRLRLEADLRVAVAERQLAVAYQSLFHLKSGSLIGFEALARWTHPSLGPIPPALFIPLAEEIGLIVDITQFVLDTASQQLGEWQRSDPSFAHLQMHVNVSGPDLSHGDLVPRVTRALASAHLRPCHLVLELTENILMARIDGAVAVLDDLRHLGVELAIDDFGTGYSSLASLSTLPINSLKIDASFVRLLTAGSKNAEIVRAVVSLGRSLGKSVIAEGIETDSQLALLEDLGCEGGQGFLLSRPMPPDEVEALLQRNLFEADHGVQRFAGSSFAVLTQH